MGFGAERGAVGVLLLLLALCLVSVCDGADSNDVICKVEGLSGNAGVKEVFNGVPLNLILSTDDGTLGPNTTYSKQALRYSRIKRSRMTVTFFFETNQGCQKMRWGKCYLGEEDNCFLNPDRNAFVIAYNEDYAAIYWDEIQAVDIFARGDNQQEKTYKKLPRAFKKEVKKRCGANLNWNTFQIGDFSNRDDCVERKLPE